MQKLLLSFESNIIKSMHNNKINASWVSSSLQKLYPRWNIFDGFSLAYVVSMFLTFVIKDLIPSLRTL